MILYNATELTKKMMASFSDVMNAIPTNFLSSFFGKNADELSISDSESIEVDIERGDEKVAVDVTRGGDGNLNTYGKYTTKIYTPPLYNEYTNLAASQLTKRQPGQDPYEPVNKRANMMAILFKEQFRSAKTILRAIELQAASAIFNGTITFSNADTMDFKRKSTHNITPSKLWSDTDADPIEDLDAACSVNRKDGKVTSDIAIFGKAAWAALIRNTTVQKILDNRRIEMGLVQPKFLGISGATYQGRLSIGSYVIECYTYDQYYTSANGTATPYVPTNQVAVLYSGLRAIKSFGAVDILVPAEEDYRALGISALPMMTPGTIVPYAYTEKESNLVVGVKSAPLLIPTQIDAIANLNVLA